MNITEYGKIDIPEEMLKFAETIKMENYKTNTPKEFQKHKLVSDDFLKELSFIINVPVEKIDYVFFSAAQGAEPHIDMLDPDKFEEDTFSIPIILPNTKGNYMRVGDNYSSVKVGNIQHFNHQIEHELVLGDHSLGCVLIMAAVLK